MLILNGKGRISLKETLRYMGYKRSSDYSDIQAELEECEKLLLPELAPAACFEEYGITRGEKLGLGFAETDSKALALNLEGCEKLVLFAATIGAGCDRLILKYSRISPARAVILQAMGASAIECWCNDITAQIAQKYGRIKPRFSCGFGDLKLDFQREIFRALPITKRLGVTLSDDLFMTPTKSVTAIVGIKNDFKRET